MRFAWTFYNLEMKTHENYELLRLRPTTDATQSAITPQLSALQWMNNEQTHYDKSRSWRMNSSRILILDLAHGAAATKRNFTYKHK